ncbi:MAG: ClpX C4-type zinc finger protein [Trebonia sp.]
MPTDPAHFQDVSCSFCGRHNREVRVVASAAGLVICQVCVARCAEIFDDEAGVEPPPGGWPGRWPLKVLFARVSGIGPDQADVAAGAVQVPQQRPGALAVLDRDGGEWRWKRLPITFRPSGVRFARFLGPNLMGRWRGDIASRPPG